MQNLGLLLLACYIAVAAASSYFITAPKQMRSGNDYTVYVNFFNISGDVNVSVEIWDIHTSYWYEPDYNDTMIFSAHKQYTDIDGGLADHITLQVPRNLGSLYYYRSYNLIVKSSGALNIHHQDYMSLSDKNVSVFIQTDKAMYKPGDKVKFRTFAVHPNLLPLIEPMIIEVYDNDRNKIAEWEEMNESGIVSKEIQLSDQPVLGNKWNILVKISGWTQSKYFEVAEYVLPKFSVAITYPRPYLLIYDSEARIIVDAKYTYGRGVRGNGSVSINLQAGWSNRCFMTQEEVDRYNRYSSTYALCRVATYHLQTNSEGHAEVVIPAEDLAQMIPPTVCQTMPCQVSDLAGRQFDIIANVTEDLTGITLGHESILNVASTSMAISFMSMTPGSYKPGLTYRGYVQVQNPDGSPPGMEQLTIGGEEIRMQIKITEQCPPDQTVSYYGQSAPRGPGGTADEYATGPQGSTTTESTACQEIITVTNYTVESVGVVLFEVQPADDHHTMLIEASLTSTFNEELRASKTVNKFETRDDQSLQISATLLDGVVRPGMTITFTVTSTEAITEFYYGLMGKGSIVHLEHINDGMVGTEHSFDVEMTDELAQALGTSANIIVWYITELEEMIADTAGFTIEDNMLNDVSVEFSLEETRPGNMVNLTVSAEEGSQVGVLVVDQSVLLLASGNDITVPMVMSELNSYATGINAYMISAGMIPRIRKKRSTWCFWCYPVYGSSTDVRDIFSNANLYIFTDAYMHQAESYYSYYPSYRGVAGERGTAGERGAVGLAGPTAQTSADAGTSQFQEVTDVREDFPETWMWADGIAGPDGRVAIVDEVPDTITSWVASAFAIHGEKGLGVAAETAKLTVFKPFFISLTLPYSLTRTEQFALRVSVFNYKNTTQQVMVTLPKSLDFKVLYKNVEVFRTLTEYIQIPPNDALTLVFWIIPVSLGSIPITVKAQSYEASDALIRHIVVEPEGTEEEYSDSMLLSLDGDLLLYTRVFNIHLPSVAEGLVSGSEFIQITATGDIIGSSMNNLGRLVRQPSGCGEQNMIGFVPNIFVMKYLAATNQDRAELAEQALGYMRLGYQRELSYKRSDGSFSAFGYYDPSGSTWLTAFVIRSFDQASPFITIDNSILTRATSFLLRYQNEDGSFTEPGRVIHTNMQGGSSSGIGLTAYITTALLQVKDSISTNVEDAITSAIAYLESHLEEIQDDPYLMAVVTYTLQLADNDHKDEMYDMLMSMGHNSGGMLYWTESDTDEDEEDQPWLSYRHTHSTDIEMTGYALLSAVMVGDTSNSLAITKWLLKKRNSNGGFYSTQDTVLGINSLAEFAATMYQGQDGQNLDVEVLVNNMEYHFDRITESNKDVLQTIDVPTSASQITIAARGEGVAVLQTSVSYHMTEVEPSNDLRLTVNSSSLNSNAVSMDVCVQWLNEATVSGMSLMSVQSLSGYDVDSSQLVDTFSSVGLKRVDRSGRNVNLYFDEFTQEEFCINLIQYRFSDVSNIQDAVIRAYSYYSPDKQQVAFYNTDNANAVEACVICPSCCEGAVPLDSDLNDGNKYGGEDGDLVENDLDLVNSFPVELCQGCGVAAILANVVLILAALMITLV